MNQNDKIKDIENVNNIIYTKISNHNINSDLYDIIIQCRNIDELR